MKAPAEGLSLGSDMIIEEDEEGDALDDDDDAIRDRLATKDDDVIDFFTTR